MQTTMRKWAGMAFSLAVLAASPSMAQDRSEKVFEFDGWTVTIVPAGVPGGSAEGQNPVIRPASAQTSDPSVQIIPAVFSQPQPAEAPPVDAPPAAQKDAPAAPAPAVSRDPVLMAQQYREIYNALPFLRSQYDANPTYRHDTTMELLFGQLRPMTINRTTIDIKQQQPRVRYVPSQYNKYGMNSFFYPFYWP